LNTLLRTEARAGYGWLISWLAQRSIRVLRELWRHYPLTGEVVMTPRLSRRSFTLAILLMLLPGPARAASGDERWATPFHVRGVNGTIYAMATFGGDIVVAGDFSGVFDVPASNIARWDGTAWVPLGDGTSSSIYALAVYGGELYAGGVFLDAGGVAADHIARWNGSTWSAVGAGVDGPVYSLASTSTGLVAGGDFTTAGANPASLIARWDGESWQSLGTGLAGGSHSVRALLVWDGDLYAGGNFATAGGLPAPRIARWDGMNWSPLGSGLTGVVFALAQYQNTLVAAGTLRTAGGESVRCIARWNGSAWDSLARGRWWSISSSLLARRMGFRAFCFGVIHSRRGGSNELCSPLGWRGLVSRRRRSEQRGREGSTPIRR
jgi:hypothetical protein